MDKEEVLFIADNRFPNSCASTTRLYMLCKLFQAAGFQTTVYIVNVERNRRFYLENENITCRWFKEGNYPWNYYYIDNQYFLSALSKRKNLKYVVIYAEVMLKMLPVIFRQKKLGYQVIGYLDEWYDWGKMYLGQRWMEFHRDVTVRAAEYFVVPYIRKRIVISRWLDNHYDRGMNFRLPTVVDLEEEIREDHEGTGSEQIILLYAGFPGSRDDLRGLVEVIDALPENAKKKLLFKIYTYNTTEEDLKAHIPHLAEIRKRNRGVIEFCGEIGRKEVIAQLKKADFSCLIRKNKKSNNAGFSTKIGESMAAGIPMFISDTSDASLYIKDGINGILLSDDSKIQIQKGIEQLLQFTRIDIERMKNNARKTAERYFDYKCYITGLQNFLKR